MTRPANEDRCKHDLEPMTCLWCRPAVRGQTHGRRGRLLTGTFATRPQVSAGTVRGQRWTVEEVRILMASCYLPVLQAEQVGERVVKSDYLVAAEEQLPSRTFHTIKDRCARISEVLRDEGLPSVKGWRPSGFASQTPNSAGVTAVIREAVLPMMRASGFYS
jgi:hypothetical protein